MSFVCGSAVKLSAAPVLVTATFCLPRPFAPAWQEKFSATGLAVSAELLAIASVTPICTGEFDTPGAVMVIAPG